MIDRALPRQERAGPEWEASHYYQDRVTYARLPWTPRATACSFCIIENGLFLTASSGFDIELVAFFYRGALGGSRPIRGHPAMNHRLRRDFNG